MQLHDLQPKSKRMRARRVARGGKRGKTAGRGTKGQKARAGHKIRPEVRDMIKKIPKLRGHGKNRARTINDARLHAQVVNVRELDRAFNSGETVNPVLLAERGMIARAKGTKGNPIKILGTGDLSKKLTVAGCMLSKTAREKIENAGGAVA